MAVAPDNCDLQLSASLALEAISASDDHVKQVVVKEGCFGLLTKAIGKHVASVPLLESAAAAMCSLATVSGDQARDEFNKEKGTASLDKILAMHGQDFVE